jgi:hypothetical protein
MLLKNNDLPDSTYKTKKVLCPLSMKVKTIHACPNEYILYRNEYSDLDKCPKCEVSRYKTTDGQINNSKRPAMKVLWYFPVVPRFQRLLEIPEMLSCYGGTPIAEKKMECLDILLILLNGGKLIKHFLILALNPGI